METEDDQGKERKMQTMDQFSHDLTLALEETSKNVGVRVGWGARRRTRSTGNLPCAPQPTEDSSSSPTDGCPNDIQNNQNQDGLTNPLLSDSDDRHDLRLTLKSRHVGNFESDSLNENFSPARFFRPNTRRKRKFKRMAVEYETTPSTPGAAGENNPSPIFPMTGTVKKRVLKHTTQENFRANLFFCGKRKRSHRDRYYDHDHSGKQHSSSVPRQRDIFAPKNSYQEHKTRTRSFSGTTKPSCERILPLNKSIISKIERISQQQKKSNNVSPIGGGQMFSFTPVNLIKPDIITVDPVMTVQDKITDPAVSLNDDKFQENNSQKPICEPIIHEHSTLLNQTIPENVAVKHHYHHPHPHPQKSGSFESTFTTQLPIGIGNIGISGLMNKKPLPTNIDLKSAILRRKHKHSRLRRQQMRELQFDDPNLMECSSGLGEFLSSSSLSSSDSEAAETNESDREGDDELTDWPGNEVMINFASKNDFKRRSTKKSTTNLPLIKSDEYGASGCGGVASSGGGGGGGDDDTLMSGDDILSGCSNSTNIQMPLLTKPIQSQPITIVGTGTINLNNNDYILGGGGGGMSTSHNLHHYHHHHHSQQQQQFRFPVKQIESEMSGETSNHFLSSPPPSGQSNEIREIRAGCRRIREERPGFTIMTSVNERLARFLQDARQSEIRLPDIELNEHESLMNLAKLYSLQMSVNNGCAILTKTSNTTQSVKIDQQNFGNRFFLSDYKRRCYDGRSGSLGSCSQGTNESPIENNQYEPDDNDNDNNEDPDDDDENDLSDENHCERRQHILGGDAGRPPATTTTTETITGMTS